LDDEFLCVLGTIVAGFMISIHTAEGTSLIEGQKWNSFSQQNHNTVEVNVESFLNVFSK
jgi:hypothetical protein